MHSFWATCFTLGLAGSLAFWLFRAEFFVRGELRVLIWDVGQGDGIWIRFPDGRSWLIDSGGLLGKKSAAARALIPDLLTNGVFRIDRLVLSHPDLDHAYGVQDLLENERVRALALHGFYTDRSHQSPLLHQILAETAFQKTLVQWISAEQTENLGGVHVRLQPFGVGTKTNNQVLLLQLQFASCRLLFMGDAEKEVEAVFGATVANADLPVHLLKVGHHGSRTSSTEKLLQKLQPQYAAISVGRSNPYGHPHPEVIARLRRHRAEVLRTDRHGYLEFRITQAGTLHCFSAAGFCGEVLCR